MRRLLAVLLVLYAVQAEAAIRTVGPGKTHTTIQACASVAVAGDTCEVYSGTYAETVTPTNSGLPGSPITFAEASGHTAIVTAFDISGRSYITIRGFEIVAAGSIGLVGSGSHNAVIENNYIHNTSSICVRFGYPAESNSGILRGNTITHCGWDGGTGGPAVQYFGSNWLIESNDISHSADALYGGGPYTVIRNNTFHDFSESEMGTDAHIDAIQAGGVSFTYSLVEGNVFKNCADTVGGGDCHFMLVQDESAASSDTIIVRYNYVQNIQTLAGASYGNGSSYVPNVRHYNNVSASTFLSTDDGYCGAAFWNAPYSAVKNNICYNSMVGGYKPFNGETGAVWDGNLVFTTGYSGEWASPYSTESTYATLKNKDPLFANYPTDGSLSASSPARNEGVALTTVAVADTSSGTSLVVSDARYFQPGWSGASADQIRIGASTTATIASIDYATNTITLTAGVSRSDGDGVYLYKKSDGVQVLWSGAPDVGAYPFGGAGLPSAPTNVRIR